MNILIADSGATKTDWAYLRDGQPVFVKTSGLHPAYLDPNEAQKELRKRLSFADPHYICFYGAGCYSRDAARPVLRVLHDTFYSMKHIDVFDDLSAVAHAFLSHGNGVAGILGTGSASGKFESGQKTVHVPSLGYVLGDEGSGADIGKRIIRAFFRKELSGKALDYVSEKLDDPDYALVMDKLYSVSRPSYYLANISKKVLSGDYPEEIGNVVDEALQAYVDSHLKKYDNFPEYPLALSGGMASHQKDRLTQILKRNDFRDFTISGGVIAALARNHKSVGRYV